jgi:hypothetical protein
MGDNLDINAYFNDPLYSLPSGYGMDSSSSTSSTAGILDAFSSSIGKVADFGFNVQRSVLANQAQSQDIQLQALKASLGFKTAQTNAVAQSQIAQYQAQGSIAQAMKAAGISTGSTSPIMLILGAGLIYFLAKKG